MYKLLTLTQVTGAASNRSSGQALRRLRVQAPMRGDAMVYRHSIDAATYVFDDLRDQPRGRVLPTARQDRSHQRRANDRGRIALADVPLNNFCMRPSFAMKTTKSPA
jgi:hypothetical protein